jgi:hypothetical protein
VLHIALRYCYRHIDGIDIEAMMIQQEIGGENQYENVQRAPVRDE